MMTSRPWYRWKSFWLGVVVLGFFGWAWMRSMTRDEGLLVRGPGTRRVEAGVYDGCFRVRRWQRDVDTDHQTIRWESRVREKGRLGPGDGRKWALMGEEVVKPWVDQWWISFPMWVPFAGWLGVWGAWLGWHGRRMRRGAGECRVIGDQ
ncbi:hypothetical protein [Luteolibacter soli]|uniref:DUF3592 domain-containing protein n=1 Tax=Luteolibacter soli TaxID=3135280 RepID=A0ABU9AV97_9BACT